MIKEREDLLGYQAKLDTAREQLDSGKLSRREFDTLREQLKDEMPEAVRRQLDSAKPDSELANTTPDAIHDTALDIADDMIPSTPAPKLTSPGLGS